MTDPLIISTWRFGARGNEAAWPALAAGGSSLDAVERVCCVVEADPEVDSVGFGGLPDADGTMTLDACIMRSPQECGSVCAMGGFLHPTSVARRVMETPHVLLAGSGAERFAEREGFERTDLLSDTAREAFEARRPHRSHDTVGVLALDSRGELAGACSSSGLAYKLPGRVGDSPIVGHGLYVDPRVGAATGTGDGELLMTTCAAFLVVERMRLGDAPLDALTVALERMIEDAGARPQQQVALIAMTPDGQWASAALRPEYVTSVRSAAGAETVKPHRVGTGRNL